MVVVNMVMVVMVVVVNMVFMMVMVVKVVSSGQDRTGRNGTGRPNEGVAGFFSPLFNTSGSEQTRFLLVLFPNVNSK